MHESASSSFLSRLRIVGFVLSLIGMTLFLSEVAAVGSPSIAAPVTSVHDSLLAPWREETPLSLERPARRWVETAPREIQPQRATDRASGSLGHIEESTICSSQPLDAEVDLAWAACQAASRIAVSSDTGGARMAHFDLRQELFQMATVHFGP